MNNFISWLKHIFHIPRVIKEKSAPCEHVDFSLRQEVERNQNGSLVLLVRTRNDGEVERE